MQTTFTFANNLFTVQYDGGDLSGLGCIKEIVTNNEYRLDEFVGLKNKTFIDIGANLGIATIIMAKLNPESQIYSFEPHKKTYEFLLKNIELNSLTNVKAFNLAVSNKTNKKLNLAICHYVTGANSTCADPKLFHEKYYRYDVQEIDCISLDEIITNNNINEVHVLKIDCEGAEFDILYDSELFKEKKVLNMVGEFHDLKYNKALNKSNELIEYCKKYVDGKFNISVLTI